MNPGLAPYDSAMAAGKILAAMQSGNLAGLETELERRWEPPVGVMSADSAERWELLDAVTGQIKHTIERMRRQSIDSFEGAEIHLGLLRHLASRPALI